MTAQRVWARTLRSYDDWSNLLYNFRISPQFADGDHSETLLTEPHETVVDYLDGVLGGPDFDEDGRVNIEDNCPLVPNPAQADTNGDGVADACSIGARVFVTGDTLHYVAVATQVNRASFSSQAGSAVVAEASELILEAGEKCSGSGVPAQPATCNLAGVAKIDITLDDGNDHVELGRFDIPALVNAGLGDDTLRLTGTEQSLDLVTLADTDLRGIESIDIQGAGANSLTLNVNEVINLSDTDELVVLADRDDTVKVGLRVVANRSHDPVWSVLPRARTRYRETAAQRTDRLAKPNQSARCQCQRVG